MAWKIAYDENLASFSPGVQVMLKATESMLAKNSFVEADSLATADHWMMNRLWSDRQEMIDLTIGLTTESGDDMTAVVRAKERLNWMKSTVKSWLAQFGSITKKLFKR